jgi:hypothetical protein
VFFCASTKVFEEALNAVKFLGWLKLFGPAQNILGPVKGQGIYFILGSVSIIHFFHQNNPSYISFLWSNTLEKSY